MNFGFYETSLQLFEKRSYLTRKSLSRNPKISTLLNWLLEIEWLYWLHHFDWKDRIQTFPHGNSNTNLLHFLLKSIMRFIFVSYSPSPSYKLSIYVPSGNKKRFSWMNLNYYVFVLKFFFFLYFSFQRQ